MKAFILAILTLLPLISSAKTITVACDEAKNLERSDSIKLIRYNLDLDKGKATLACGIKEERDFCGSMRMDLNKFLNSTLVDKDYCVQNRNDNNRQIFNFYLAQEDEFDNLVSIVLGKSCETGKVNSDIVAVITHNQTDDVPETAQVVKCHIVKPIK